MKRRTILIAPVTATATATATAVAADPGHFVSSIYGTPGSASATVASQRLSVPRLTVSLSRLGLPADAIAPAIQLMELVETLFRSARARQAMLDDPVDFFQKHGITFSEGASAPTSVDTAVLRALLSQPSMDALNRGDITAYMLALEHAAVISPTSGTSDLSKRIAYSLQQDRDALGPAVQQLIDAAGHLPVDYNGEDLQIVEALLRKFEVSPMCWPPGLGFCTVYLLVVAASWVAVVATVYSSVTAITRLGVSNCVRCEAAPRAPGTGPGRLMQSLAPDEMKRYEVAIRVARIRGRHDEARQLTQKLYGSEMRAVLDGIEQSGRFDLSGHRRRQLEHALLGFVSSFIASHQGNR